tara:strand:+ start:12484 stop:13728 length:1245 start_codon:yes stop_codon:yes gene_type:complete
MKIAPGTPLSVSLHWDADDIQLVGRLAYRDRIAYLEYDEGFQRAGLELSPVHHKVAPGLQKPYQTGVFEGLHGVFNDSLPDGWGRLLIDRRARQLGIGPATLTPLDRLACVGASGIGALCYAPETEIWKAPDGQLDLDELAQDARRVLDGEVGDLLSILGKVGGSPGGARPKALIAVGEGGHAVHGTDDVPDGYAHYLVKFQGHGDPEDIAAIEMAYAVMAKDAGIEMPETRLLEGAAGKRYFAARRFDRVGRRRVHVHSASGLLYSDIRIPALDYKDLILLTRAVTRDQRQCQAMFTLAVFNVLAHNRDDHARQFSYIMERDGTWRLAPAYDLTWASGPGGEHSTSVLGHGRDITRKHLTELAKKADVKPQEAAEIIERVKDAVAKWPALAREYGVGEESARMIEKSLAEVRV